MLHWELVPSSLWVSVLAVAIALPLYYWGKHLLRKRAQRQRDARRSKRRARQTAWEWVMGRRKAPRQLTDQRAR